MTTTTTSLDRFFFRCLDCLSTMAVEFPRYETGRIAREAGYNLRDKPALDWLQQSPAPACGCGGALSLMGRVTLARLAWNSHRLACDARCQSATGPSCNCACGGDHHGTHAVVAVSVDAGRVPTIKPANLERSIARAQEFRAAKAAAKASILAEFGDVETARRAGIFVEGERYWGWRNAREAYAAAKVLKTHKGRLAALARVLAV